MIPWMRHIICFGNPLHGDDGFGHAVYQRLAALPAPADLRLFDAGTPGLSALALFRGCDETIIVDARISGAEPGSLSHPSPQTLIAEATLSSHGAGVGYLLRALEALPEPMPKISILAAEISTATSFQWALSSPVASAVDKAVAILSCYFHANGHE